MTKWICAAALGAVGLLGAAPAAACGPSADCRIGERAYRIAMPDGHDGATPIGAIVYAHGYRGSAAAVMRNQNLLRLASELGVALIAAKSFGEDWALPNAPGDNAGELPVELTYFDAVIADAAARFPIDTRRLLATGFSAGGMMVWTLACHRSELFAGFAPVAGTFWSPTPETCASPPADVLHIHGDDDKIVPLAGRQIANTRQGNVYDVLEMYAAYGGFGVARPEEVGSLSCERRENAEGRTLTFCLFSGGHSFRTEFVRFAWDRLVAAE